MKNFKKLSIALVLGLSVLSLVGCGNKDKKSDVATSEDNKIVIGVSPTPHGEVIENLQDKFKEANLDVTIVNFDDYVQPNIQLADGDLDANYFQHKPYLDSFSEEHSLDLEELGYVHIEPMGIYSKKYKSLEEIQDGEDVIIPNDASNGARALILLEKNGLIKLNDNTNLNATEKDIVENPKNLKIVPMEAPNISRAYEDAAIGIINSNFALTAGLNPQEDAIILEGEDSPYSNLIAVRKGNAEKEKFKKFLEIVQSEETENFIKEKYNGAITPAFK